MELACSSFTLAIVVSLTGCLMSFGSLVGAVVSGWAVSSLDWFAVRLWTTSRMTASIMCRLTIIRLR